MKNWLRRAEKFFSYSFTEQLLIVNAFWVVLSVRLALKLLSFQRFRALYASLLKPALIQDVPNERIERYVWAIERVSGSLLAVCLPQALALKFFLRRDKGTEIVIGVDKKSGFSAHAWVEKNGKILIGDTPQISFQPIWRWQ
ncbi:lasso peptide biosynthesis B2 protein [Spirosoma validum]|uniref:Lasso peptide biosynthesis B2 protein n=1 Tax=Spirosoma validum TaxID=2771355 RepID=A0A927AZC7_9BACT|nr:lasso peptide biosynthesis B2 protein [Spirosoma validum]MBD2752442.1 lasso peptide biosynthesis B2 protein [Spirosoma validum]